jgi:enoyl-CoA hydratase/carnithine racemase
MSDANILYDVKNGAAVLTLNQPAKMNAMTFDMWSSVPGLIAQAEADRAVRVIVLTGAGEKAFCAGADISQFGEKRTGEEAVKAYEAAVTAGMSAVSNASKPVVARIRGYAFGGGLALALCCDLRLSTDGSRFRIPAARLGLGYAFSNVEALVHRIGLGPASDLLLSARIVDGTEGERLGLVNKMWAAADFDAKADEYIGGIATNAPLTLKALKLALAETAKPKSERDRAAVDALVAACFTSADYKEGQAAFKEKRNPDFRGE